MKNKFLLISTAVLFCLTSCKKSADTQAPAETDQKQQETALHSGFACQMKVPVHTGPVTEANGPANQLWTNGSTIKVRFSGGSTYVRSKVKQYAKSWEASANVTFSFVADNAAADIKIAFDQNDGSWSYVGKESKNYSPSMNYGWFNDNTSDTEFRRTVTHEFGHALGLNHEQSHPDANIPWNTQAVYDYYMGPPNNWSKEDVDFNVLAVESRTGLNYTAYDSASIMHYPVEARFTTNNKTIAANNTTISAKDVLYMKTYYPGRS
ncbi:M12 family metallopeptidase [Pedobacter lusitanus]|nr:M12 family metallopeptidase [Pedobacter lusitanus]